MLSWKGPIQLLALHRTPQELYCESEGTQFEVFKNLKVSGLLYSQWSYRHPSAPGSLCHYYYYYYWYYNFCFNPTLGIFENLTLLCSRIRLLRKCISNAIYFTSWRMQAQLLWAHRYCLNSSLAYFIGNILKHFLNFATKRAFEPCILLIVTEYQC